MLCLVNERRSGPPWGPVEDNLLLFCNESSSQRNRRNSLKWWGARLNYSAFTINFCQSPLISTPPRTTEPAGSSWECWRFPVQCTLRSVATWEAVGAWILVWVCNLVCWIIKPTKCWGAHNILFICLFLKLTILHYCQRCLSRGLALKFHETWHELLQKDDCGDEWRLVSLKSAHMKTTCVHMIRAHTTATASRKPSLQGRTCALEVHGH